MQHLTIHFSSNPVSIRTGANPRISWNSFMVLVSGQSSLLVDVLVAGKRDAVKQKLRMTSELRIYRGLWADT